MAWKIGRIGRPQDALTLLMDLQALAIEFCHRIKWVCGILDPTVLAPLEVAAEVQTSIETVRRAFGVATASIHVRILVSDERSAAIAMRSIGGEERVAAWQHNAWERKQPRIDRVSVEIAEVAA